LSCEASLSRFLAAAAQTPAISQALADTPENAAAVLAELFEVSRGQTSPGGSMAELRARAGCTALFERMRRLDLPVPAHGENAPGMAFALPASSAARHAYAVLEATIAAAEAGEPLPPRARGIAAAVALRAGRGAPPPLRRFDRLFHVGRLDPAAKGTDSHEGAGLSIARHPEDWRAIARLGDAPVWDVNTRDARFLDFHAFRRDKVAVGTACDWAVEQGYLERGRVYVVTVPDEEEGGSLVFRFLDEAEAEDEARGYLAADLDGDELEAAVAQAVRRAAGYLPTARLAERMRHERGVPLALAVDLAVVAYAEDVLDLDGVWWEDAYDPALYSAPRGVLFARRLSAHTMALAGPDDEDAR
jgi:hypothetical protein